MIKFLIKKFFFIDVFEDYIGEYYSPFKIKNLLEDLDELIETNNLQYVEHNVEEIIEGNSINIVLTFLKEKKI